MPSLPPSCIFIRYQMHLLLLNYFDQCFKQKQFRIEKIFTSILLLVIWTTLLAFPLLHLNIQWLALTRCLLRTSPFISRWTLRTRCWCTRAHLRLAILTAYARHQIWLVSLLLAKFYQLTSFSTIIFLLEQFVLI